ncbi:MAG: phenylacetate--CoA ligase family protein [candidate division Zixibacteria bacterium]|nr:phenylacetate--CoA ligase family protein [candidate division Zixibacteria bacterium]MDH3936029.1 phenylacetate--CoA ligase family protein [candidate division Zixibacteria bacterium]MDH4033821.1 phenylacetate--CoA ligase family protein [candidate division Zixibacteria bacterium]
MDLIRFLAQRLFLPLSRRREGFDSSSIVRQLEKSQYLSLEEIRGRQFQRLKTLLENAYDHVPYYRALFDERCIVPDDISSFDDFEKLPPLTKSDVRDNQEQLLSSKDDRSTLIPKKTGGSTGVPLHLYWSRDATAFKQAATQRHDAWSGYAPGEKLAQLWGADAGHDTLRARLYNYLVTRRLLLDTLEMSEKNSLAFVEKIRRYRPPYLLGHAHSVYVLALFLEEHGIVDLGISSVICTAEVLTDGERHKIEQVFSAEVFNRYGCEELSVVASECEQHEGLHINSEGLYVEVIGGDEEKPGELVITDLVNDAMPFIRYQIEDTATIYTTPCACGRGLPRLKKLYGRSSDFLYTPDGRMLSGISIMDHFAIDIPGVWQVQLVQDALDHLFVKIVRTGQFGEPSLAKLAQTVPAFFGKAMRYDVEYVKELPMTARGKYQFAVSKIDKPN